MEVSDGVFRDLDDEKYNQRWGDRYRIERVTALPGTLRVPVPHAEHCDRAVFGGTTIIVGERGAGMSRFTEWLVAGGEEWVATDVAGARAHLNMWKGNHKRESLIVDRTLPNADQSEDLAVLAGIVDDDKWTSSRSRLVCLTREVKSLRTDPFFSTILSRGHLYRLPHFDADELEQWVGVLCDKTGRQVAEDELRHLGQSVKLWVGGQAFLTHLFFCHAESRMRVNHDLPVQRALDETGEFLANHKPHIAATWQTTLRDLIRTPSALRLVEGYARGHTKKQREDTFPRDDVDLFLAGWVGLMPDGTWGIRSHCHAQWAREVLRGGVR